MGMPDGVQIDVDKVAGVGRGMREDASQGFAAAADRSARLHGHGVEFGSRLGMSVVVSAARDRYAAALANVDANLRAHQQAAAALADAAEEIARLFSAADH